MRWQPSAANPQAVARPLSSTACTTSPTSLRLTSQLAPAPSFVIARLPLALAPAHRPRGRVPHPTTPSPIFNSQCSGCWRTASAAWSNACCVPFNRRRQRGSLRTIYICPPPHLAQREYPPQTHRQTTPRIALREPRLATLTVQPSPLPDMKQRILRG